ncbi:hypothetical protein E4U13_001190 [Claviceps humidiphila]|uniref:Mitochondrial ribosomal protein YmL8 n=2 Tax=Claviceps TaxID=5110 RepID=A0A9P7SU98_9HYPO|nr:hypothetical protein E4U57_008093 [Claviceps arundinis]KAG5977975.1 hypothetical protein E4U56_006323 [Claviceps arundinis]KAG6117332.1 hypothetical protein E4U13_001190 [Claviceps humidiphila]
MAGGAVRYRHLSRNSSARQALLRGLVTQLVQHEHIQTTHAKAKEAQRMAEKLITLAKRNNEPCRRSAHGILYTPEQLVPKLFGELRERYLARDGGYTRVTRTEPKNTYDQSESSILEFVDGPRDSRFMMTAKTLARDRLTGRQPTPLTMHNAKKVTAFRGQADLDAMVKRFEELLQKKTPDMTEVAEAGTATDDNDHSREVSKMADREQAKVKDMMSADKEEPAKSWNPFRR